MAYGLKYTATAYGLSNVAWKVELLENGYSGSSSEIQLVGNGIKIGYDNEDDRFNNIYSRYAIIDLKVTSTFNLDSLQFDDERKFQVKIYKNNAVEFIGWLIPFYSSQEFEDESLATISIQAKDGINQLKNIAYYNSNPTSISFKQSFKDVISQSLSQTGYALDLEIYYNKYDASMAKTTSDCPLAQLYFNVNTLSKNETEWYNFYEVLQRLLTIHNLRLFQGAGKWVIIDQMDLIEGVIYGRKYNSSGTKIANVSLNSDSVIHTGGLKVKTNTIVRKDIPYKQYSAFFNAGALSNLLKNGELTSFSGLMPNGWSKVGTWGFGDYGPNVTDGVNNGIKFQNKYTQSLNYNDTHYFESEEIDVSSYDAFTLDFEAYADSTIDAIKIGIKLYDNTGISSAEYFVDKMGIPRQDGRAAIIEKGFLDTFFKFQIECIISSATLYLGNITALKVRIYPGFTYNTVPTNTIVKYRNLQLRAKDEEVSKFKGRYFQVTNTDLPKTSKNAETYDVYYQDNLDYIKANYNNFLYVGDSDIETQSWKRNTDTESNPLVVSVLKDKLAVTATYNDILEGSVFGFLDFINTPIITASNKRFLVLNTAYNLQENATELNLVELKSSEVQYNTSTTDDYGGNNTVNSTSSHGSFNLDSKAVRKYIPEAGGNMYGELLVTGSIDAVPLTSTDILAINKGILNIAPDYATTVNLGNDLSTLNIFGDTILDTGLLQLNADGNTNIGLSVLTSGVESNYFKLISDTWTTDTGFKGDYLDFNTSSTALGAIGRLKWNDQDGTLDLGLKGGNVTLQIGQEQVLRVVNKTGATLNEADFRAVRIRDVSEGGSQGNRLAVKLAQADSDADSATTIGIVTETIGDNQEGFITTSGNVSNIDTTGAKSFGGAETWNAGDILYLDPVNAGYLTNVKPQAPNHTIIVGWVVNAHQNQGKIFVKVDNGYEIDELHNVKITTVADKDVLIYNNTLGVWENKSILNAGLLDGSGTANYLPKWTDSNTLTNSILYESGGLIGIGTTSLFSIGKLALSGASGTAVFSIERSNPATNAGLGAIAFKNTDATTPFLSAITSTFGSTTSTSYLSFRLGTASASPYTLTEVARISTNGNFIIGGTFADIGTKFQVVGDSFLNGAVGIGSSSLTGFNLRISKNISGSTTSYSIYQNGTIQSDVTANGYGVANLLNTQATTFTLSTYYHYIALQGTIGAGSAVTTQFGFMAGSNLTGATNNYGFRGQIPSGTNNWNLYMDGTAPNYFVGAIGIGSTALSSNNLRVVKSLTGASTFNAIFQGGQVQTDVSVAHGFRNDSLSIASISNFTDYIHYSANQGTMNTAPTNHYGVQVNALTSGTNIFGFYGNIASSATRWNLYMNGTAKNYLNGSLLIGSTTDNGYKLDVTGTGRFTGVVQFDAIPTHSLTPSLANHIVNKAYVDSLALVKRGDNVKTISLTNITLSGTQTINGVALVAGDLILVAGQTTQTTNGVYVVASGAWARSTNNDSDAEIRGAYHFITAGTYANQRYINTNTSAITIGTTNITYAIDFGAETDPIWSAFKTENSITPTSVSNWNTAYTNTTNGTFYLATNPSNYITLSSLSAGAGLSYNSATGVFSYSGTIYTDSLIRGLISGIAPISYNSSTGEISMLSATSARDGYLTSTDWTTFNNKIGGSGTTNYISKFNASNSLTNSIIFDDGTNIGIGTASPTSKLHVVGTSLLTGNVTTNGSILLQSSAYLDLSIDQTDSAKLTFGITSATNETFINVINNEAGHITGVSELKLLFNSVEKFRFNSDGNLGIGTTSPSYKLHVAGDININSGFVYRINGVDVSTNWTTGYNRSITAITIGGTTTKTLTLTKQDGTTLTANFTDENSVSSVNGLSGAVVLTTSNISEGSNLYFTTSRVLNNTTLTGFQVGQNTSILATDTILGAFNKIQAQLNAKLSSNQTITLTGDATGSGTTSIALTLANSGVTAGTYRSVTVDVKGRVTAGTNPTTISGYGITDFYTQTIPSFTASNSAIISGDTLLNALQKAQGQINNSFKKTDISSNDNYLVKFATATNTLIQSLIFDNGVRIGIGTDSPTGALQINSNISRSLVLRSGYEIGNNIIEFLNNANARIGYIGHGSALSNNLFYNLPNADSHIFATNNATRFIIDGSGNVGINTSTLTYRLNVDGDINLTSGSKLRLNGSTGLDHQFLKFDGTNHVWAYLNVGELEDADSIVKYELDNGERGIKFYTADKTNNVFNNNDTLGFIFTNEDTGIFGIHGYSLNSSGTLQEYGIQIDQDTNIYRLKADGKRARILTTDDSITGGGTTYSFSSPLILSNNSVSIQKASSTSDGYLSADDWNRFNSISGGSANITASSPLIYSNGNLSIQQATSTQNGFLSANDWNSFNSKLGGNGGLIDGGNLSIRTSLLIGTSNADYAILSPSLYKLTIAQNSSSLSEIIIQSKNGIGGTVKIDTNNFYIGNVRIDMSTYGAGKKLTYLSATEATWQ